MPPITMRSLYVDIASLPSQVLANRMQIVGYLAAGLVMTTSAVSTLIYQPAGVMQAAAAGFILLSMISVRIVTLIQDKI